MTRENLILDRYQPIGTAGAGGFGTVQIAWDPRIQRKVAIKTIRLTELDAYRAALPGAEAVSPEMAAMGQDATGPYADEGMAPEAAASRWHGAMPWDEYLEEGFAGAESDGAFGQARLSNRPLDQVTSLSHLPGLDEARTAAKLSDPRIVTVYDFEIRDRTAYLIMEYVEGITLSKLLAHYGDELTLDMVAAVFDSVAGALQTAHKAGVLHLDIKPDNIMIDIEGKVKVTDFGLATLADASGSGTTGGGTIGYMPLEQMRREHLDARTDEWSLASVTYEMLTGDNPFHADSLANAEAAIEDAELILPSLCWNGIDDQIDDVVFYALDPDRDERYASIADFAEEVDKFLGDAAVGREQLAEIANDALGYGDEDAPDEDEFEGEAYSGKSEGVLTRLIGLFGTGLRQGRPSDGAYDEQAVEHAAIRFDDEYEDDFVEEPRHEQAERTSRMRAPHEPLSSRVGEGALNVLGRSLSALGSGFITWLALVNMPFVPTTIGAGTSFMIAVGIAVVAAIAAIVPAIGAFISIVLLGAAIMACGHPLIAALLVAAALAWLVFAGRQNLAATNAALSLPPLGAIGASPAAPLLAGAAVRFPYSLITCAFVIVEALVLASLGSDTLNGWDAFSHWSFSRTDITANFLALVRQASTWATAAGWLAACTVLSLLRFRDRRWLTVFALAIALALLLVGSFAFAPVEPAVVVSSILAAAALIVLFV